MNSVYYGTDSVFHGLDGTDRWGWGYFRPGGVNNTPLNRIRYSFIR